MEGVSESERERSNLGYWGNKEGLRLGLVLGVGYERIREGVRKGLGENVCERERLEAQEKEVLVVGEE